MISFPPCKINLGLNILARRPDGYHDLESVFLPLPLCDALELVEDKHLNKGELSLSTSGILVPGDLQNNLIVKAHRLFHEHFPLPGIKAHLHKVIPMGGGLGGGSSNGTWMLRMLNEFSGFPFSLEFLKEMAEKLGSDCPFFLYNEACLVQGRGERVKPFPLHLKGWYLVLLNPGVHVSTAQAFSTIHPGIPGQRVTEILKTSPDFWSGRLVNDFEKGVSAQYPEIQGCIDLLKAAGADYVSMSGTGASVFGLFRQIPEIKMDTGVFHFACSL